MDRAYSFLINDIGIKSNDSVIVACSGGPDSMALLSLLVDIKKDIGINVIVAHINHNVRAESESEKDFVHNFCKSHDLIFEYMKINDYSSDNFESEARSKRYKFFDELSLKYNSKYVLTAHHGDDLMETILMRIVRGSTLKGYSGFSSVVNRNGYKIIRPLIHMSKSELLDYDKKNNINYVVDKTNFMDIHTRNRYRKYILPDLKKEDINVHDKFYKFSFVLSEYNRYIESQVDSCINDVYIDNILYIDKFLELDNLIGYRVIYRILESFYKAGIIDITDKHVNLIYNLIVSSKPNAYIYLPHNVRGVKSYNEFKLDYHSGLCEYNIEFFDYVNLPNGKNIEMVKKTSLNSNNVIRLNSADIVLPLYVRSRKNGDRMVVKGMSGSKKINDIFIDCKVPMCDRDIWPIVIDGAGSIVWVPGLKKSKFDIGNDGVCDIILKYY